jgi:hypothetical protein
MKKLLSLALSACIMLTMLAGIQLNAFAATWQTLSYTLGENVKGYVTYDRDGSAPGSMVVKGTGTIRDFTSEEARSWTSSFQNVATITVEYGVTAIGTNAFANMPGLQEVYIPQTVKSIGNSAFKDCSNLTKLESLADSCIIADTYSIPANAGLTIYAAAGSTLQTYATDQSITFSALDIVHITYTSSGDGGEGYIAYKRNDPYNSALEPVNSVYPHELVTVGESRRHKVYIWQYPESAITTVDRDYIFTEKQTTVKYEYTSETVAPTCTEDGYDLITCKVCGHQEHVNTVDSLGHLFDIKEQYCLRGCGTENPDYDPDHQHVWDGGTETTPATCTEAGETTYACTVNTCGATKTEPIEPLGHQWDAGTETTPATCTADGVTTYSCTRGTCTETKTEPVPALGHDPVAGTPVAPTCTEKGYTTYKCSRCDYSYKADEVPAARHSWDDGRVTVNATCTSDGEKLYSCLKCTATKTETVRATGHSFDGGVITKAPTCKADGVKTFTCSNCGFTKTKPVAKTAHKYETVTVKATLKADGSTVSKCSVCGAVESKKVIAKPAEFKLSCKSYSYDGKKKTPAVTVKDSEGRKLVKDRDYTVSYSKNKKIGKAKVTVKFKGNYSGTKKLSFKIKPKKTNIKALTAKENGFCVKWRRRTSSEGYQIQYATDKAFTKNKKKITVKGQKKNRKTVKKLRSGKKYYVRICTYKTVNGKKYYSAWTDVGKVKTK